MRMKHSDRQLVVIVVLVPDHQNLVVVPDHVLVEELLVAESKVKNGINKKIVTICL
jgi:hypothetical protein